MPISKALAISWVKLINDLCANVKGTLIAAILIGLCHKPTHGLFKSGEGFGDYGLQRSPRLILWAIRANGGPFPGACHSNMNKKHSNYLYYKIQNV
jgi:hypothetical protein